MPGLVGRFVIYGLAAIGAVEVFRRYRELRDRAASAGHVPTK